MTNKIGLDTVNHVQNALLFPMFPEQKALLEHLTTDHRLSADEKKIILIEYDQGNTDIFTLLLEMDILTEEELLHFLSTTYNWEMVASFEPFLHTFKKLAMVFPHDLLEKYLAVPLKQEGKDLTLAMVDIKNIEAFDVLQSLVPQGVILRPVLARKSHILQALHALKPKADVHQVSHTKVDSNVLHDFLHWMLVEAVNLGASDIHLEPEKFSVRVRYRLDGLLKTAHRFHQSFWQGLCIQLKILSQMDIAETRKPQDGRFRLPLMGKSIDFRVACHPTLHGENMVLRVLDQNQMSFSLDVLGYPPSILEQISCLLQKPEGMIVLTGPTGSGKTTSLYGMLATLDTERLNVMTLEEPVEYYLPHIRQSEVKDHFSFAEGVRSILRQDPDVILVGEIRDEVTAEMAVRASMTGHLVFTTLHTLHALGAIYRLMELKIPLSVLGGVINGIVSQRLVRKICESCKQPKTYRRDDLLSLALGMPEWDLPSSIVLYRGEGCETCQFQGYRHRTAIAEVLVMDNDLESMILDGAPYDVLQAHLLSRGFQTLRMHALQLVLEGKTTLQETKRVLGV